MPLGWHSDKACVFCEVFPQAHSGGVSGEAALVQAFSGMVLRR